MDPSKLPLYENGGLLYNNDRVGVDGLNGSEMLVAIAESLLPILRGQLEEAKLRCEEEEGDDTTLGEYIALKSVVEQLENFFMEARFRTYSRGDIAYAQRKYGRTYTTTTPSLYPNYKGGGHYGVF